MNYISAHLWEKGKEHTTGISLILQHASVCKREVLLACVCESENTGEEGVTESGYFSEGLTEWFHREGVKLCEKRKLTDAPGEKVYEEIRRLEEEIAAYLQKVGKETQLHYAGVLLWENRAWFFTKGECKGYLLNRRFQKKNVREILQKNGYESCFVACSVQKKVGLLLCTENFGKEVDRENMAEVLMPDGKVTEERMEKRLKELCKDTESVGAIYLRIC